MGATGAFEEREEDQWAEVFYRVIAAPVPPAAATEKDINPLYPLKGAVGFAGKNMVSFNTMVIHHPRKSIVIVKRNEVPF